MGRNHRARWSAIGAAVAVSIGAGGLITFASASGGGTASTFTAITPCRLLDTRVDGPATGEPLPRNTPLGQGETLTITARGNFGKCVALSAAATGAVLNVTTVNPSAGSFLTVWPADKDRPLASSLNWVPGQGATPNQVTTGLDSAGKLSLFNNAGTVDVIVDVVGLYEPAGSVGSSSGGGGGVGPAGPAGGPGAPGAPGAAGSKGSKGDAGAAGAPGAPGIPGGPIGPKGDPGTQGPQGSAGTELMTSSNPDLSISNGAYSSMKLDSNGLPVISQYDSTSGQLRLTRCSDPACVVAHSNVVDGGAGDLVGQYTSLVLDASEFPVISYYDFTTGDLKLAHCNDADCAGGDDPSNVVDSTNDRGQYSSLALDSIGRPVISYYDATSHRLLLAHCNDTDCTGGDDAPLGVVSTGEVGTDDVGQFSSMALDLFDGFPTIAYYNATQGDLKLIHCTDQGCTGPQSSVLVDGTGAADVGANLSMTLDLASNPVISYYDATNLGLSIARCDTTACAAPTISQPLVSLPGPIDTSIAMDNMADVAVVSYIDSSTPTVVMRVVRCDDAACNTVSSSTPDSVSGEMPMNTALVLDLNGNPTIARFDSLASRLTVTHCTDPLCTPHVRVISAP